MKIQVTDTEKKLDAIFELTSKEVLHLWEEYKRQVHKLQEQLADFIVKRLSQ